MEGWRKEGLDISDFFSKSKTRTIKFPAHYRAKL